MGKRNTSNVLSAQVGARIEALRRERGFSLSKLARMAKCSEANLSLIEWGCRSIHVQTLRKIAQALQVKPFDLLNHETRNDDIGYIVEKMRKDPAMRVKVKGRLAACDPRTHVAGVRMRKGGSRNDSMR